MPRSLGLPCEIERVDSVAEHQSPEGEGRNEGEIGDFAEVDITTHLLVAIQGNHDSNYEKYGTHRFVKEDADRADQIVEGSLEKLEHFVTQPVVMEIKSAKIVPQPFG